MADLNTYRELISAVLKAQEGLTRARSIAHAAGMVDAEEFGRMDSELEDLRVEYARAYQFLKTSSDQAMIETAIADEERQAEAALASGDKAGAARHHKAAKALRNGREGEVPEFANRTI